MPLPPSGGVAPAPLRERPPSIYTTGPRPVRMPEGGQFEAFRADGSGPGGASFSQPPTPPRPLDATSRGERGSTAGVHFGMPTLILLEVAAAAGVLAWIGDGIWRIVAAVVAVVVLLVAILPVDGWVAYQWFAVNWSRGRRRREFARQPGLAALVGGYQVIAVPGPNDVAFAAVHSGAQYTVVLELLADDVIGADVGVRLADLEAMLTIENVPLRDVRLLTVSAPLRTGGSRSPAARATARYCVLTFDSRLGLDALTSRGGSHAAIEQILRRCQLRARELLVSSGLRARALDEQGLHAVLDTGLGPAGARRDERPGQVTEDVDGVWVGGTYSTTIAVAGDAEEVLGALPGLAVHLPGTLATEAIVLSQPMEQGEPEITALLRASVPAGSADPGAVRSALYAAAGAARLTTSRLHGDQVPALRLTTALPGGEL